MMKIGPYQHLTDIAYALHFHDPSHSIRKGWGQVLALAAPRIETAPEAIST
jgi:hypothetical protein